ncbi:MAG TPA: hypothetical protein VGE46_02785 [Bdellovibrio sp.]
MKTAVGTLIFTLLATVFAQASLDSVGVFHRPERVVVLINEDSRSSRLSQMMDSLNLSDRAQLISADGSIKIECGRTGRVASCTFRFLPSDLVVIGKKNVQAKVALENLKMYSEASFVMEFESAMQDRFIMQVSEGSVSFFAHKRGAQK